MYQRQSNLLISINSEGLSGKIAGQVLPPDMQMSARDLLPNAAFCDISQRIALVSLSAEHSLAKIESANTGLTL